MKELKMPPPSLFCLFKFSLALEQDLSNTDRRNTFAVSNLRERHCLSCDINPAIPISVLWMKLIKERHIFRQNQFLGSALHTPSIARGVIDV